jgi:hypothetical protein
MEFEDYAKKIGAFLTPYDVECIFSTIEEVLAEARF